MLGSKPPYNPYPRSQVQGKLGTLHLEVDPKTQQEQEPEQNEDPPQGNSRDKKLHPNYKTKNTSCVVIEEQPPPFKFRGNGYKDTYLGPKPLHPKNQARRGAVGLFVRNMRALDPKP